jgi:hypothetical protein
MDLNSKKIILIGANSDLAQPVIKALNKIINEIPNLDYLENFDKNKSINNENLRFNKLLENLVKQMF